MSSVASGRSETDVLQSSLSEYRRTIDQKGFPHQEAWEWLNNKTKWELVTKASDDSPPLSKQIKTSSFNACISSSDPQYPHVFSPKKQQSFSIEDSPPHRRRKGKKVASTSSTENEMFYLIKQIFGIKIATKIEAEQRQWYREKNCAFSKLTKNGKLNYCIGR
ncbi:unnamed protein product [Lactuca saligna]|uniref:Uncharacterized protein n=1 Tax=Lactuca saligna TaxID=75948 RepID=A0AA35Z226_LACSI|nr:unnamed protein product [Lactuca saligna]